VEIVTVDVVVTDKAGKAVKDLTRDDFTVLDEGKPQPITTFEAVNHPAVPPSGSIDRPSAPRPRLATNQAPPGPPGRSHVIVFDNLHMTPLNAQRAKGAVAAFLEKGVGMGDRVTLIATGGGPWWTTTIPEGRAEMVELLKGLEARRFPENATDRITDYEAMRIYVQHDSALARRVQQRLDTYSTGKSRQASAQMQEIRDQMLPGVVDPFVESRATETYLKVRTRSRVTLGVLERAMKALGRSADRKALILVSEGFVFDPSEEAFRSVTEAARHVNASIYFLDTRGLEVAPLYSAQFGAPIVEGDLMAAIADMSQEGDGALVLAQDTGGFAVRNANDLTPGVLRIGTDARNYYLLGFDPPADAPRDGRFRRLTVKVKGRNLNVRARKGYYAPRDENAPAPPPTEKGDRQFQEALDSPYLSSDIPLRATAYVLQESTYGKARVLIAADADVSDVAFREVEGRRVGTLDLLIVVADRRTGDVQRYDQKIDLERKADATGGPRWYSIVREFDLAAGPYQTKVLVRDVETRRLGTVAYDFEVPDLGQWWISTPILTDAVQASGEQGALLPVLLARRSFEAKGALYCRFDVSGMAKDKDTRMPKVSSGHRLRRADGTVVSRSDPTPILPTSLGAITRMIGIPLDGLAPGEYELSLTVNDELAARSQEILEPFTLTAPAPAAARR
jgi:VWFA-related protein